MPNPKKLLETLYGVPMQDGGKLPPGIKRATERAKESKSVLPIAGARQARQAIQGYLGMDPSFSVMDPEAQALESAYRGGETASVLGDLFASLTPFAAASAASKANQVPGLAELIAYHGSPHKFKKFDASKIGTGEGAQAYGHGLYFAENPEVAKSYRITTTGKLHELSGVPSNKKWQKDMLDDVSTFMSRENISDPTLAIEGYAKQIEKLAETFPDQAKHLRAKTDWLLSHKDTAKAQRGGSLYTVDIPDEKIAQMLDWDKPLSQQPWQMKRISPLLEDSGISADLIPKLTGKDIMAVDGPMASWFGVNRTPKMFAEGLRQEGIPGIKYLDQASRDAKQGTRNFVVFPGEEQNIKMLDINGEPQMAAGGAIHMQDGGDPTQMFNFNPMAAKAAKQKQMRESTPETPLGALSRGFASGLFGNIEDPVPYTGSIMEGSPQRQQSQANLREIGRNVGALTDIGGMVTPFTKPATQAITRGATALGRTGLEQVDRAMFGEGPLASLVAPVAPLQAVPRVQAPVSRLGFYDPVEQAGLNIQRKQGPGQAFLNELQRSENVSKDFLEASGIAEKLRTAPNITRDEVQAMTKGAVPEVQEVVLGSNVVPPSVTEFAKVHLPDFNPSNKDSIAKLIQVADQRYQKAMADGDLDIAEFAEQAETEAKKLASQYESGSKPADRLSKYAEYQLPGGKNYREVLLTVPEKSFNELPKGYSVKLLPSEPSARANEGYKVVDQGGIALGYNSRRLDGRFDTEEEAIKSAIEALNKGSVFSEKRNSFRSSHWEDPNIVSHIRMNDRTDFNGKKVLFIEEMQSDWAQEGRKKGFAPKDFERQIKEGEKRLVIIRDQLAAIKSKLDQPGLGPNERISLMEEYVALTNKQAEEIDWGNNLIDAKNSGIPEGPFVKNTNEWVDLSLKSILKRAVDEGYDRVAFINGKQSADRYDLANYVDNIQWDNNVSKFAFGKSDIDKTVEINLQNGERIRLPITSDGKVVNSRDSRFDGKNLDDIIGKDVAKKIVAGEAGTLEGEGLSIGGEGMKKFYDHIVPDRLRKLVGKDNVKHIPGAVRHYGDADDYEIRVDRGGNSYYLYNTVTGDSLDESFNNLSDAHNFLEKLNQRNPALPQLGFDITPEIREKFSKPIPYKTGGAVRISDNPDTMLLELLRKKHA